MRLPNLPEPHPQRRRGKALTRFKTPSKSRFTGFLLRPDHWRFRRRGCAAARWPDYGVGEAVEVVGCLAGAPRVMVRNLSDLATSQDLGHACDNKNALVLVHELDRTAAHNRH